MSLRIAIADDHPLVRDGLRLAIETSGRQIVIVAEANDGVELLKMARRTIADIYIIDITMPNMNGINAARELLKISPEAKIIMLSLHGEKPLLEEAFAVGARGYLTKETAGCDVVEALMEVQAGRQYIAPQVAQFCPDITLSPKIRRAKHSQGRSVLTPQERRVLQLLAEGKSNKEIAAALDVTTHTVHTHRNRAMAKLNIHKQADLVRYAVKAGIAKL